MLVAIFYFLFCHILHRYTFPRAILASTLFFYLSKCQVVFFLLNAKKLFSDTFSPGIQRNIYIYTHTHTCVPLVIPSWVSDTLVANSSTCTHVQDEIKKTLHYTICLSFRNWDKLRWKTKTKGLSVDILLIPSNGINCNFSLYSSLEESSLIVLSCHLVSCTFLSVFKTTSFRNRFGSAENAWKVCFFVFERDLTFCVCVCVSWKYIIIFSQFPIFHFSWRYRNKYSFLSSLKFPKYHCLVN